MRIDLHIILPQLRLLLERLRLTFAMEGGTDQCFLEKEPKHWNQLEATAPTQHHDASLF